MSFTYERAGGDLAGLGEPGTHALAGGTDLIPLHKVGLVRPARVLDLKTSDLPSGIEQTDGVWRIGALTTLAEIEDHRDLRSDVAMVGEAVSRAATRQLRNRATVAGNLLQQPRCRYYRSEDMTCWFAGGDGCPARDGRNEHHAIFETGLCVAVQPSDLASSLVCAGAEVELSLPEGSRRTMAVSELLAPPTDDDRRLHRLPAGAAVVAVTLPAGTGRRSAYRKAMDRAAWQFALAGVAASIELDGDGTVTAASIVASGVASVPWRLTAVEDQLVGQRADAAGIDRAAAAAAHGATPLSENAYKQPLLRGLVERALQDAAAR